MSAPAAGGPSTARPSKRRAPSSARPKAPAQPAPQAAQGVGINGFGRIGRLAARVLLAAPPPGLRLAAVNGTAPPADLARLLEFDSTHGRFALPVRARRGALEAGGARVALACERDPARLDWQALGASVVLECSGASRSRADAARHLEAGAARVLVSAPLAGADRTVVQGLNHRALRASDRVVSAASCTTNCLAWLALALHRGVGIRRGFALTVHAYTSDQRLLDGTHRDPARGRAAALSAVPAATGAGAALALVAPELAGRIECAALRVPLPNVSRVDLAFEAGRRTDAGELSAVLARAARARPGLLGSTRGPLVSADFNGDPRSAVFALDETRVAGGRLARAAAWYDNEWAYANRLVELAAVLAKK